MLFFLALACTDTKDPGTDPTDPVDTDTDTDTVAEVLPLQVGLSFHLEGWPVQEEPVYQRYIQEILEFATALKEAGALASFEADRAFTEAVLDHGDTLFTDLEALGHTTGVHADLGGNSNQPYDQVRFEADLTAHRTSFAATGGSVALVSGICSHLDWVEAALAAGFTRTTGSVAYCTAALDADLVPEQFADCETAAGCHERWPEELPARITPWRTSTSARYTEAEDDGPLLILPSSGGIPCLAEMALGQDGDCTTDMADIDLLGTDIDAALAARQPGVQHTYYLVWSYGKKPDTPLFTALAEEVSSRGAEIVWATPATMAGTD